MQRKEGTIEWCADYVCIGCGSATVFKFQHPLMSANVENRLGFASADICRINITCGCGLSADLNLADVDYLRMQISDICTHL